MRLDDCEIIALENLLKYVMNSRSEDDEVRKNAVMARVGQLPCENIFKKIIRACFLLESLDCRSEVPQKSGSILKKYPPYLSSSKSGYKLRYTGSI